MTRPNIQLLIRQKERILFEGEVKAFTSSNDRGDFDILNEHANFISIINKTCTIHKLDGTKAQMEIDEGIIRVTGNKINVYLGIGL